MFRLLALCAVSLWLLVAPARLPAQCAMCKRNVETAEERGDSGLATGLNNGIVYLLAIPYGAAALLGFWYWRKRKHAQKQEDAYLDSD